MPVDAAAGRAYLVRMQTAVQGQPALESRADTTRTVPSRERSPRVALLVAASAAAALVNAKSMVDNASHDLLLAALYGVLSFAQVMWAGWVYNAPRDRRVLMPAAIVSLALIALWLISRFVGLPLGPTPWQPLPIGIPDFAATLDELLLAGLIFAIVRPRRRIAARLAWLDGSKARRVASTLCSFSVLAMLLSPQLHVSAAGLVSWCVP
jgi:hypothetical protein